MNLKTPLITSSFCLLFIYNSPQAQCIFVESLNEYSPVNGMTEAEANGWSHYADFGMDSWRVIPGAGVNLSNGFSVAEETPVSLLGITDSFLQSPTINLPGTYALSFSHKYDFEADASYYDGGQLQISTNNGNNWADLNPFITIGGYNEEISSSFNSPIQGQMAWAGEQELFAVVEVDLTTFANQNIQIRWRFTSGTDSIAQLGWRIDNIKVFEYDNASDTIHTSSFEQGECS